MFLLPKVQNKASTSSMFLTKFICSQPILLFQFVNVSHFSLSMEFLKLKTLKSFCIQMFMARYLFLELRENNNTEYLIPTK